MSDDFSSLPVDDLLQQLRDTPPAFIVKSQMPTTDLPPVSSEPIKEEDLGTYIIGKTVTLLDSTMNAFKEIKDLAVATNDADTITALADLVKAANSTIDSLNKIHIQNKKIKAAKEIAHIQTEARIKLLEGQQAPTNILTVGTREEILRILEQATKKSTTIDAEVTDLSETGIIADRTQDSALSSNLVEI